MTIMSEPRDTLVSSTGGYSAAIIDPSLLRVPVYSDISTYCNNAVYPMMLLLRGRYKVPPAGGNLMGGPSSPSSSIAVVVVPGSLWVDGWYDYNQEQAKDSLLQYIT